MNTIRINEAAMEHSKVEIFLLNNGKFFSEKDLMVVRERLERFPDYKSTDLFMVEYKPPIMLFFVSLFAGHLGLDRFLLGQNRNGILKLITCGGLHIWWIIDLFSIMEKTKEYNFTKFLRITDL